MGANRGEGEDEGVKNLVWRDHIGAMQCMIDERRLVESASLHPFATVPDPHVQLYDGVGGSVETLLE